MAYNPSVTLNALQHELLHLVQTDTELSDLLELIGFPKRDRKDVTGMVVLPHDGDLLAVWITEDSAWYDLTAIYRPLPYYKYYPLPNLPDYWQEHCEYYQQNALPGLLNRLDFDR